MNGQTDNQPLLQWIGSQASRDAQKDHRKEVKEEIWVESGKGADRVKEIMYGRREKTKGKTFRTVRLRERRGVAKKKEKKENCTSYSTGKENTKMERQNKKEVE